MTVYVYLQLQHDEMMIIRNKNKNTIYSIVKYSQIILLVYQ